jgi:hypothetical protein
LWAWEAETNPAVEWIARSDDRDLTPMIERTYLNENHLSSNATQELTIDCGPSWARIRPEWSAARAARGRDIVP